MIKDLKNIHPGSEQQLENKLTLELVYKARGAGSFLNVGVQNVMVYYVDLFFTWFVNVYTTLQTYIAIHRSVNNVQLLLHTWMQLLYVK